MGAIDRWRTLPWNEQQLTIKSALVLGAAVVAIRVFGVARTLRIAARPVTGPERIVIGTIVTAIDRAGRYVPGGTCLPKSLALAWLLRGVSVAATVRLGVKTAAGFEAHAWVECNGVAVETVPPGYAAI